jgi:hypothetical protein
LISGVLSDLPRSRADLIVENALLRQQLIVLDRQAKRPLLTDRDRLSLVLLARFTKFCEVTVIRMELRMGAAGGILITTSDGNASGVRSVWASR